MLKLLKVKEVKVNSSLNNRLNRDIINSITIRTTKVVKDPIEVAINISIIIITITMRRAKVQLLMI